MKQERWNHLNTVRSVACVWGSLLCPEHVLSPELGVRQTENHEPKMARFTLISLLLSFLPFLSWQPWFAYILNRVIQLPFLFFSLMVSIHTLTYTIPIRMHTLLTLWEEHWSYMSVIVMVGRVTCVDYCKGKFLVAGVLLLRLVPLSPSPDFTTRAGV